MAIDNLGNRIPDNDDNLGTFLDIVAGPFAGALMHSRDYYRPMNAALDAGGPIAQNVELRHLIAHGKGSPYASIVEGGLGAVDGLNQAVNGDPWGGLKSATKRIGHANGGLPALLSHWIE